MLMSHLAGSAVAAPSSPVAHRRVPGRASSRGGCRWRRRRCMVTGAAAPSADTGESGGDGGVQSGACTEARHAARREEVEDAVAQLLVASDACGEGRTVDHALLARSSPLIQQRVRSAPIDQRLNKAVQLRAQP